MNLEQSDADKHQLLNRQLILKIENMGLSYPEIGPVLSSLSLNVFAQEFVSILGPSGCGKSSLLKIIAGLETQSEGHHHLKPESQQMSFVFQDANLMPWRNLVENVLLPLEVDGKLSRSDRHEKAMQLLKRVHLADAAHLYPHQLSGGMKMRASLARALVSEPRLLLMDEPFAALDEPTREHLQNELRLMFEDSKLTIIFVTHSLYEAIYLSDRAVLMSPRPGKIIEDIQIKLPQKRDSSLRWSENYFYEYQRLRQILEQKA